MVAQLPQKLLVLCAEVRLQGRQAILRHPVITEQASRGLTLLMQTKSPIHPRRQVRIVLERLDRLRDYRRGEQVGDSRMEGPEIRQLVRERFELGLWRGVKLRQQLFAGIVSEFVSLAVVCRNHLL